MNGAQRTKRSKVRRFGEILLKILGIFVILEPIWMLLPFAGFLYGSVFHIQILARNPATAWLTHFVWPILTLGWLGPVMILLGFGLFSIGAFQVYRAKIRRSGLVTNGLYRFVRHPQYISLTLFGVGILLTWGRAITFIAFFFMMFLYYYLAKSEERVCRDLFGDAYEHFRERTSFIIPGDRLLRPLRTRVPGVGVPAPLRVGAAFVLTMAVCLGLMWMIGVAKKALLTVPYLTATVDFEPMGEGDAGPLLGIAADEINGVPFAKAGRVAVVRGPHRNAGAPGFAEQVLARLGQSNALKGFLAFLDKTDDDVAIVFCAPFAKPDKPKEPGMHSGSGGAGRRGPPPDPYGAQSARLIILRCTLTPGAGIGDVFAEKSMRRIQRACIAPVNLASPANEDIVQGKVFTPGPGFPGEKQWDFFLEQLKARRSLASQTGAGTVVPGRYKSAELLLVKAPILRTRRDSAFAQEIMDRLTGSSQLRDHLAKTGAGGDVVAVAFPRPGPNWYQEHHQKPQISVFVMLVRLKDASLESLFKSEERNLIGAFTVEVDFSIGPSQDSVYEIAPIGPKRDLEERWRFFLSGL
jgi:protein-S-isoprenylcysteine O-methyltransferase Ste14